MCIRDSIKAVRTVRNDMGVPPSKKTSMVIETQNAAPFEEGAAYLAKFASAEALSFTAQYTGQAQGTVQVVTNDARAFIPMMELIDREKELARLAKEKANCEKELAAAAAKLANEGFTSKAPAAVVQKIRDTHAAAAAKLQKIEGSIAALN